MSEIERDDLFEGVVNEKPEAEAVEAKPKDETKPVNRERRESEPPKYDFWDEVSKDAKREYRKVRVKGFFRALVEIGGYAALGGVMLAAMLNGIVAAYVAVPVFTVSWIWSAIRMDRFFRR